jgi:UDP-N-acetylmuramate dehydrogenase
MVLDTRSWSGWEIEGDKVLVRSGTPVDDLAEGLGGRGFSGLEFLAGMPGTVGGAVWMNARCYDREIAGPLLETEVLEPDRFGTWRPHWIPREPLDFAYKKSPFQGSRALILNARFALERRDPAELRRVMAGYCKDRKEKGHYRYPSAGSAFKNNRDFGKPTGKIIDELGLRGLSLGGAQVAPWHGNLIINTGTASAGDIRGLVETLQDRVRDSLGLELEPEILFVGDWDAPATGP